MTTVVRVPVNFVGDSHSYFLDGEKLAGVSTVAKIGDDDAWGIASAWGFRIGYEGAHDVLTPGSRPRELTKDGLRAELQKRGLTPWATRDKAGDRGTWVHDVLEKLGQAGEVDLSGITAETRPHAQAVCGWYVDMRPLFEATEVQVVSVTHRFAGRYDIRARIRARLIVHLFEDHESEQADRVRRIAEEDGWVLCLIDLKTSKRCYPTSHFPQLSGYELASVEMGFPATDAQFVLNTHPDGTYDFIPSWSTADDFLAYLSAHNAIKRIKAGDPERRREERRERLLLSLLPMTFAELQPSLDLERGALIGMLKNLKKRGLIEQVKGAWKVPAEDQPTN